MSINRLLQSSHLILWTFWIWLDFNLILNYRFRFAIISTNICAPKIFVVRRYFRKYLRKYFAEKWAPLTLLQIVVPFLPFFPFLPLVQFVPFVHLQHRLFGGAVLQTFPQKMNRVTNFVTKYGETIGEQFGDEIIELL